MANRCDFCSDEDYEHAVQMEIDEYREQLAKEELFAQYCQEEYAKENGKAEEQQVQHIGFPKHFGYYHQHVREENFTKDAKIEALREPDEITVVVWYAIERGEYLEIFRECNQLTDEVWDYAQELAKHTAEFYDKRCNIVDLVRPYPDIER